MNHINPVALLIIAIMTTVGAVFHVALVGLLVGLLVVLAITVAYP